MKKTQPFSPVKFIVIIYFICFLFRGIEYMILRTDRTIFGEAFIHKLTGIVVLLLALRYLRLKWHDIGFTANSIAKHTFFGLFLGASVFVIAYGTEFFLQLFKGSQPSLRLYVTSYAIDGNQGMQTGLLFFSFCIVGNLINVAMEEGVFRGLFVRLFEENHSFTKAVVFSSVLFGFWHIAAPLRSLLDADISPTGAILSALMLILTTALTGAKFCLLTKITGSLWMPMADHFFNNTIVNLLHVTTLSGADELQVIRISIAQTISFLIVLFIYFKKKSYRNPTFRDSSNMQVIRHFA